MDHPLQAPPFPEIVAAFEACLGPTASPQRVVERIDHVDAVLGDLLARFRHELCFQDLSPEEDDLAADVMDCFQELRRILPRVREHARHGEADDCGAGIGAAIGQLRGLGEALAALRRAEEVRPVESPFPAVNAVLRVGRAVVEERLDFDSLEGRMLALRAEFDHALDAVDRALPFDPTAQAVRRLLESHGEAQDEVLRCVGLQSTTELAAALWALSTTANALGEALHPPDSGFGSPETTGVEPDDLPEFVGRVADLVERAGHDPAADADLRAAIEEVRRRARSALEMLESVPAPPPATPPDEIEAWEQAQMAVENGLERFFVALEHFDAGSDLHAWERGVAEMRAAVTEIRLVSAVWSRLVATRSDFDPG